MCGGVGKTFRYLPQFVMVVVLRGLNKFQLCLQFGNVREKISLNDLCQCLCECVGGGEEEGEGVMTCLTQNTRG